MSSVLDAPALWAAIACLIVGRTVIAIGVQSVGPGIARSRMLRCWPEPSRFRSAIFLALEGRGYWRSGLGGGGADVLEGACAGADSDFAQGPGVNLPKVHQLSGRKWTADVRSRCPLLAESGHLARRRLPGGICLRDTLSLAVHPRNRCSTSPRDLWMLTADFAIYAFSLFAEKSPVAQTMNAWTMGDP